MPRNTQLFAGTGDGVVVYSLATLERSRAIGAGKKARCEAIAVHGDLVAGGGYDSALFLWRDAEQLRTHPKEKLISALAFSPDGKVLAAGSQDNTCKLFTVADGKLQTTVTQTNTIRDIVWSPDGTTFATICADGPLAIWAADGTPRHTIKRGGIGHHLAYSAAGTSLAAADTKGNIAVYDPATGKPRHKLKSKPGYSMAFLDENTLLTSGKNIDVWNLAKNTSETLFTSKLTCDLTLAGETIVVVGDSTEGLVIDRKGKQLVKQRTLIDNGSINAIVVA